MERVTYRAAHISPRTCACVLSIAHARAMAQTYVTIQPHPLSCLQPFVLIRMRMHNKHTQVATFDEHKSTMILRMIQLPPGVLQEARPRISTTKMSTSVRTAVLVLCALCFRHVLANTAGAPDSACTTLTQQHPGVPTMACTDCPFNVSLVAIDGSPVENGTTMFRCGSQHTRKRLLIVLNYVY